MITVFGSLAGCALNSRLHQLLPREGLGAFFAKRLFWGTASGCIGTLAAGLLMDHWPYAEKQHAYSVSFGVAGLAGFVSAWFLTRVPEPQMTQAGPHTSVIARATTDDAQSADQAANDRTQAHGPRAATDRSD